MGTRASKTDQFTHILLSTENLDLYIVRTAILKALDHSLPYFTGKFLDVGCGKMPYKERILNNSKITDYIGLDIENALQYDLAVKPDYTWDGKSMPFDQHSFDCAMATEVLEHCPEPGIVLGEIYRILKPGGILFFTVPFLWPLHEVPHDEYRYTPFALKRFLQDAGFKEIDLRALGGWDASLAQMLGLWVRRRPLKKSIQKFISMVALFIIKYLSKKDTPPTKFRESTMVTGIWGVAIK